MPRPNTRSSSQALRQPASATDVNVIKVLLVLLRRLENNGKWNVRKMIEELQKDIQEAASFELRNLWYLTDEKKNGDPTAFVDVGDRRPHSDRQPATPEDLTNAQWFFQAVFSELGKEYDRRQHWTPTSAEFRAQFPSTARPLSKTELISKAREFAPDGYNEGFQFLED